MGMGEIPHFDTRTPEPVLYGPLSQWILGQCPADLDEMPASMGELAEALDVELSKLHRVRASKGFREFHSRHTSEIGEVITRRQEMIDRAYELGMQGNVTAMNLYLNATRNVDRLQDQGKRDLRELSPQDAERMTDEELLELSGQSGPSSDT